MSNEELREEREKRQSPEGQLDKNGDPVKFCKPPARMAYAPEGT